MSVSASRARGLFVVAILVTRSFSPASLDAEVGRGVKWISKQFDQKEPVLANAQVSKSRLERPPHWMLPSAPGDAINTRLRVWTSRSDLAMEMNDKQAHRQAANRVYESDE